jgi:FkbM family methyltransferase
LAEQSPAVTSPATQRAADAAFPAPAQDAGAYSWRTRLVRTLRFGLARLTARDGYISAPAGPFEATFVGPARDVITRHIYRFGAHEPTITRYVMEHVRLADEEVALDIGANIGWYSVLLSRLSAPRSRIYAFEPDVESFVLLQRNLYVNGAANVTAVNCALGAEPGTGELRRYKHSNNGRHSLLGTADGRDTLNVRIRTLAGFWQEQALAERPLGFMKIDVEGFEYFVLRGAGALLARCAQLILEYSPEGLRCADLKPADLTALLASTPFTVRVFTGDGLAPISLEALGSLQAQHDLLLTRGH